MFLSSQIAEIEGLVFQIWSGNTGKRIKTHKKKVKRSETWISNAIKVGVIVEWQSLECYSRVLFVTQHYTK